MHGSKACIGQNLDIHAALFHLFHIFHGILARRNMLWCYSIRYGIFHRRFVRFSPEINHDIIFFRGIGYVDPFGISVELTSFVDFIR